MTMSRRYLRMLEGLKQEGPKGKRAPREWSVYILRCGDGSYYTGIAKDVEARLEKHNAGKGAAYTRTHLPVSLAYREDRFTRSGALIREARIKSMNRPAKARLVKGAATPRLPRSSRRACAPSARGWPCAGAGSWA